MGKIVVIEDAEDIISAVYELLSESGHVAFATRTAADGIRLVKHILPDLIICDIIMPQKTGLSFLEDLKNDPTIADIPLIFLSAMTDKQIIQIGLEKGAAHYITKPYDAIQLINVIDNILSKK